MNRRGFLKAIGGVVAAISLGVKALEASEIRYVVRLTGSSNCSVVEAMSFVSITLGSRKLKPRSLRSVISLVRMWKSGKITKCFASMATSFPVGNICIMGYIQNHYPYSGGKLIKFEDNRGIPAILYAKGFAGEGWNITNPSKLQKHILIIDWTIQFQSYMLCRYSIFPDLTLDYRT